MRKPVRLEVAAAVALVWAATWAGVGWVANDERLRTDAEIEQEKLSDRPLHWRKWNDWVRDRRAAAAAVWAIVGALGGLALVGRGRADPLGVFSAGLGTAAAAGAAAHITQVFRYPSRAFYRDEAPLPGPIDLLGAAGDGVLYALIPAALLALAAAAVTYRRFPSATDPEGEADAAARLRGVLTLVLPAVATSVLVGAALHLLGGFECRVGPGFETGYAIPPPGRWVGYRLMPKAPPGLAGRVLTANVFGGSVASSGGPGWILEREAGGWCWAWYAGWAAVGGVFGWASYRARCHDGRSQWSRPPAEVPAGDPTEQPADSFAPAGFTPVRRVGGLVRVECPHCRWKFAAEAAMAGRDDRCPQCAGAVVVGTDLAPDPLPPEPAPPATVPRWREKDEESADALRGFLWLLLGLAIVVGFVALCQVLPPRSVSGGGGVVVLAALWAGLKGIARLPLGGWRVPAGGGYAVFAGGWMAAAALGNAYGL